MFKPGSYASWRRDLEMIMWEIPPFPFSFPFPPSFLTLPSLLPIPFLLFLPLSPFLPCPLLSYLFPFPFPCPYPYSLSPARGLESAVSPPSPSGSGRRPTAKRFCCIFGLKLAQLFHFHNDTFVIYTIHLLAVYIHNGAITKFPWRRGWG